VFSRENRDRLGYDPHDPLLSATRIRLRVVVPVASSVPGSLLAFQKEVNRGLADLISTKFAGRPDLVFSFEQLPADFDWRLGTGSPVAFLDRRTARYTTEYACGSNNKCWQRACSSDPVLSGNGDLLVPLGLARFCKV